MMKRGIQKGRYMERDVRERSNESNEEL